MEIRLLELTLPDPEQNLALDEALLDQNGEHGGPNVLRVWEAPTHFVVLGRSNRRRDEVFEPACKEMTIPILRRSSGGGTVLQGPGCLNYSLVLGINEHPELADVTMTNHFIMRRHREAIEGLLNRPVTIEGTTDLALDGRKFSGNAQRRRRHAILFHGTLLHGLDVALVERCLRLPNERPAYRAERSHRRFLTTIPTDASTLSECLKRIWGALEPLDRVPSKLVAKLVRERYGDPRWTMGRT